MCESECIQVSQQIWQYLSNNRLQICFEIVYAFVGAFFGFLLAMYLDSHADKRAQKKKIRLVVKSIRMELFYIHQDLLPYVTAKIPPERRRIPTPVWDAVLSTGFILDLIERGIHESVLAVYSDIKHFNYRQSLAPSDEMMCVTVKIEGESEKAIRQLDCFIEGRKKA